MTSFLNYDVVLFLLDEIIDEVIIMSVQRLIFIFDTNTLPQPARGFVCS